MALIAEEDRKFLVDYFQKELTDPVKIVYFTQRESPLLVPSHECMYCKETKEILDELSSLSDRIELEVHDFVGDSEAAEKLGVDKIPATVLQGKARGKVRFFGIPSGYEFATLIESLVAVSTGKTDLSDDTLKQLAGVSQDLHIQVFTTPT